MMSPNQTGAPHGSLWGNEECGAAAALLCLRFIGETFALIWWRQQSRVSSEQRSWNESLCMRLAGQCLGCVAQGGRLCCCGRRTQCQVENEKVAQGFIP